MYDPADEVITERVRQLRSHGEGMLRGDYSLVPALRDLIRSRAERVQEERLQELRRRAEPEA
jgi:hypothetical protein